MKIEILEQARIFLISSLKDKVNEHESKHPWRREWQFTVLHSFRVEEYVSKILLREKHNLSDDQISLIRLAAILHDVGRLDNREIHAQIGSEIASNWLHNQFVDIFSQSEIDCVKTWISGHSNKGIPEKDFGLAVLKDADVLDEIGVMSIFMAGNWLDNHSPYFFDNLKQKLINVELSFCDQQLSLLNTQGGKQLLMEKKSFITAFIDQLSSELEIDQRAEILLNRNSIGYTYT